MKHRPENSSEARRSQQVPPLFWPLIMTAAATGATASLLKEFAASWIDEAETAERPGEPGWATANRVTLELPSMRLRDFSARPSGQPTLICAPFALHGATVADFATGHSIVEALHRSGLSRIFVTDWRSATPDMRFFAIDNYLADLNVAVDEIGPPVDLIGLCQGGWLSLIYAARFPAKVRRLVLVGAPIDFHTAQSQISRAVANTPLSTFENLVRLGDGRVLGRHVLDAWAPALDAAEADRVLQVSGEADRRQLRELERRFRDWYAWTVDLPGTYYLQTVDNLYKQNQIAKGQFIALGHKVDLANVHAPLFLLAARDDELVTVEQLFAAARLVGTDNKWIESDVQPCGHLSLFLGARTLKVSWARIARWLATDFQVALVS
jgi:poly(3-hydroxyalkanoate) synthetase